MKERTNLLRLLLFINSQPCHKPVWLNEQRLVTEDNESAVYFRLVGNGCQITVPAALWTNIYAVQRWVEPSLNREHTFLLTLAGREVLEQLRQPQEPSLVKGKRRGRTPDPAPIIDHQSPPHRSP